MTISCDCHVTEAALPGISSGPSNSQRLGNSGLISAWPDPFHVTVMCSHADSHLDMRFTSSSSNDAGGCR